MVVWGNVVIDIGEGHQSFVGKSSMSLKRKLDVLPPVTPLLLEGLLGLANLLVVVSQGILDESTSFCDGWLDVCDTRFTCIKMQIFTGKGIVAEVQRCWGNQGCTNCGIVGGAGGALPKDLC